MPIVKLDAYTIEQIAAGEVIESPVSVVKELVENSIDADAKNIVVEIKNGGKTYIRVTDDGSGIEASDISLAFEKHTTSKISSFNDLYDIYSLGFRGEALASIVSVSNLVAISKTNEQDIGKKIEYINNKANLSSIATNKGTSIIVSDLFNNLPVRKKFLKSDIAETNAISKLMYSLAIGYNNIAFKYIKDNRIEFITHANDPLDLKISNLLDNNLKDNLIEISSSNEVYKIEGFVSNPNYYRGSRALQYLYVNNRLIDSSIIVNTIEKEYRSLIPNGRFPAFVLFINTNPKNLDINVHPNKRIIKFNYEDELINLIEKSVRKELKIESSPSEIIINNKEKKEIPDLNNYQSLLDSYKSFDIVKEQSTVYEDYNFFDENSKLDIIEENSFTDNSDDKETFKDNIVDTKPSYLYLSSIFDRYSIFRKSNNEIMIMDHRRADEAIKFNKFIKQMENKSIDSQVLLKPIIINLKANDKQRFNQKREFILNLGFDINQIGEDQIIVRSIPQLFDIPEKDNFFYDILDLDFNNKNELFYKSIVKFIRSHAFRKGHKIGQDEARYLLNELFNLDNPYKSYDGKSTILIVSKDSLEKFFER